MSKYQWDIKEIRDNYKVLLELKEIPSNEDEKFLINESIENMEDLIKHIHKQHSNCVSLVNDLYKIDINTLLKKTIDDAYENIVDTELDNKDIVTALIEPIDKIASNYNRRDVNNLKIIATNEEIIKISDNFFRRKVPRYVYNDFKNILDSNKRINIGYSKNGFDNSGFTISDKYLNEKFINITRENTLDDIAVLPHEVFHYIFGLRCKDFYYYNNGNSYLTEIEGSLADYIFADYFKKIAVEEKYYFIEDMKYKLNCAVTDLAIRILLLDSLNKDTKELDHSKFLKLLNDNLITCESIENLRENFRYNGKSILTYGLSHIVALDLYYIYLHDQDKCFYLLRNIIENLPYVETMKLLRDNEITFMDDGYVNLVRYMKK